ncbi:MAG TPA: hypothetical protein VNO14_03230, partial [Blastocatellia bacterium]|nr:hypothetical protein [Blastocatellia bacterium]
FVFGVTPSDSIDINLDINLESAENKEAGTLDRTFRLAPSINWRISPKSTFAGSLSTTFAGDAADTKRNRNVEFDVQWTYQFGFEKDRLRKLQGQFFIRFASLYASARDRLFGLDSLTRSQTLNMGLSFTFF